MNEKEYVQLGPNGEITVKGTGNFVTQSRKYLEGLIARTVRRGGRNADKYTALMRYDMAPGTSDALTAAGKSPRDIGYDLDAVHMKVERGVQNVWSKADFAGIFNFGSGADRDDDLMDPSCDDFPPAWLGRPTSLGFVTKDKAESITSEHPEVVGSVIDWMRRAIGSSDWEWVRSLANLAVRLEVDGLEDALRSALESSIPQEFSEDIVDILGELRSANSVGVLRRTAERCVDSDAPAFWLCQKIISSLGEIGTTEALECLRGMAGELWPNPVRWHAAVELGIETALGFDEDEMPGGLFKPRSRYCSFMDVPYFEPSSACTTTRRRRRSCCARTRSPASRPWTARSRCCR
jgi:hypothetical protein